MFIQAIPQYLNANGHPAVEYLVYIGRPNTDPTIEANKLPLTDGFAGRPVSNPYQVGSDGFARNSNGQRCNPYIEGLEYAIEMRSPAGSVLYRNPRVMADSYGTGVVSGGDIIDAVIGSFSQAKAADLSEYNTIYVESYASGWEDLPSGPVGGFYAYRTGSVSTPSSGNPGRFCDAEGNEFRPFLSQRLYAEMFGASSDIGVDCSKAFQDMLDAASERGTACYADGGLYRFDIQDSNTNADYSLFATYAVKLPEYTCLIGNGSTELRNTSANSDQVIFFAEDCEVVRIEGFALNGNATSGSAGVLYSAGCTSVFLPAGTTVLNSAPIYLSASKAGNVTGSADIDATFVDCFSFCLSGLSGGSSIVNASINAIECFAGCEVTADDIDGHGVDYAPPNWNIGRMTGSFTNDAFKVVSGSLSFGSINVPCRNVISIAMSNNPILSISGNSIESDCARFIIASTTSANGIVESINIGSVSGNSNARAFSLSSTLQLINKMRIGYLNITGGNDAFYLQDGTGLGSIELESGTVSDFATGITFTGSDWQSINIGSVDFSGCTSRFSEFKRIIKTTPTVYATAVVDTYDAFSMHAPDGWVASKNDNICRITHNIGHNDYVVNPHNVTTNANRLAQVSTKTSSYFEVRSVSLGAGLVATPISLTVTSLYK